MLQRCVQLCRDDDSCAAVTFDYDDLSCSLWRPGTTNPGSTYATDGGIAMKTFTSAYIVTSIENSTTAKPAGQDSTSRGPNATAVPAMKQVGGKATAITNQAAVGLSRVYDDTNTVSAKHLSESTPGLFSYTAGSAAAAAALSPASLVKMEVSSLTSCLNACVFDNLCSGVVFGAYDAMTDSLGSIAGVPAGPVCQKIQGTVQPGNSKRTLIKTRNVAALPA